jgi:putative addiction module killer protein
LYPAGYTLITYQIRKTDRFASWIDNLRDLRGRARILARIERLAAGHAGDARPVGEGVSEMRIDTGPGYRVYYVKYGEEWIVLLAGGDKSTQSADIKIALELARNLKD